MPPRLIKKGCTHNGILFGFSIIYSFTEPDVSPDTMRRWNKSTMMTSGIVTTTVAAEISPQGIVYCPWNMAMPTGTVLYFSAVLIVKANKNSFQAAMKTRMDVVNTPGTASGKMTLKYVCIGVAPSIFAASSKSNGILRKKVTNSQIDSGSANVVYGIRDYSL